MTCGGPVNRTRIRHCQQKENATGSHNCNGIDVESVETCGDIPCRANVKDLRLPTHLKPEKYTIELVPFVVLGNFTFKGHVEIIMVCEEESRNVTLHVNSIAMTLKNETIELTELKSNKKIAIENHDYDVDREFYIAKLSSSLNNGTRYKISIDYVAKLRNDGKGFYYYQFSGTDE